MTQSEKLFELYLTNLHYKFERLDIGNKSKEVDYKVNCDTGSVGKLLSESAELIIDKSAENIKKDMKEKKEIKGCKNL